MCRIFTLTVFLAAFCASLPVFAQSREQLVDRLVTDEIATYRQVLDSTNAETLKGLRQQFGEKAFSAMQSQGIDKKLISTEDDLKAIMAGIRDVYLRTFNETELRAMVACTSNPDYQPVKAKLPALAVETQRFIAEQMQRKMIQVTPVIQRFVTDNPALFQPAAQ